MTKERLQCEMRDECKNEVTHIGDRGYIYCAEHAVERRNAGYEHTRKMRKWEIEYLLAGLALPSYKRVGRPSCTT